MHTDTKALMQFVVARGEYLRGVARTWTPEEDDFLRKHLGYLTDAEMAQRLGRSAVAVHLRWDRDLGLPCPSKDPRVITAQKAAELLGIDAHQTVGWVDMGLIPGRIMAGGRSIRLIDRLAFRRWVLNPMNWPYFDIRRVLDPELKRMLKKRAARWGDAWLTTRQVADLRGVPVKNVEQQITRGQIHSFHLPVALSGRHWNRRWSYHFVLRSDALAATFARGRGGNKKISRFTPAADRWILYARDVLHFTFVHIGRTMKIGAEKKNHKTGTSMSNPTISYRYRQLKELQASKRKTRKPPKR